MEQEQLAVKGLIIRTSDRSIFRRCRRRWYFQSALRRGLSPKQGTVKSYLWFGTGFHFAMEDYHGFRFFGTPFDAFEAYMDTFKPEELDDACMELADLFEGMVHHYVHRWAPRRNEYQTLWINGIPQVEVEFRIYISELSELFGIPVWYQGRLDRVVVDTEGRLWIMDYKTVSQFDIQKLETDPQISNYSWSGEQLYGRPVEGLAYMQFRKAVPEEPRLLVNGGVSYDSKQKTTYEQYYKVMMLVYKNANKFPPGNQAFMDVLAASDTPEGDNFIRIDTVRRNKFARAAEYQKILAEGREMLNSETVCYPNPTRDCYWDCTFRDACLAMDDGSDWEWILQSEFVTNGGDNEWRKKINWPLKEQLQSVTKTEGQLEQVMKYLPEKGTGVIQL